MRCESQHNERWVYKEQFLCLEGRYDRQRTLASRIAAITLASDSGVTLAMSPDGYNPDLNGFYLFSPVRVRRAPLKTPDFKGF